MGKLAKVDVAKLFALWSDMTIHRDDIARRLGISVSRLYLLKQRHGLPDRPCKRQWPRADPTPEQIAERARECREKHYAQRRAEPYEAA